MTSRLGWLAASVALGAPLLSAQQPSFPSGVDVVRIDAVVLDAQVLPSTTTRWRPSTRRIVRVMRSKKPATSAPRSHTGSFSRSYPPTAARSGYRAAIVSQSASVASWFAGSV